MTIYITEHPVGNEIIEIQVEMDNSHSPLGRPDARDVREVTQKLMNTTRDVWGDALQLAHNCAASVAQSMKQIPTHVRPDEFEVKFCVKLDSEVGAIIAKMGAEAQLEMSMKWTHKEAL